MAQQQQLEGGWAATGAIFLVMNGLFLLLALLHYAFYHYNPTRLANRYFAGYALAVSLGAVGVYCAEARAVVLPSWQWTLALALGQFGLFTLGGLWLVRAVYQLFDFRAGRRYAGLVLSGGLLLVQGLTLVSPVFLLPFLLFALLVLAELLRLTGQALRARRRGASLVAGGFAGGLLGGLLAVGAQVLVQNLHVALPEQVSDGLQVAMILVPALGISLYLVREFALDSELLQVKLREVERLSAHALAQEQDKQALLASHNEVLERQVAERTHALQHSLASLQASQQLLAAQAVRLGELDEAKNQFFANASHELRTPLTLVLGPLDALLTDPARPLPAALRPPVALAHHQARRLQVLVDGILDLTKLQAGRLEVFPAPTAVAPLLRRVVAQFELLAAERGLALHIAAALPDELHLLLDADKVAQILTNLLSNALRHTPAGGQVQLVAELPAAGPPTLALTVRDTGPGIAASEQARIFERFYQSPHLPTLGGTGLGLALSRELALLLGGTLALASTPGQGAAFSLHLPAQVLPPPLAAPGHLAGPAASGLAQAPAGPPPPPGAAGPRPRVLVVEDQPDLRAYLRELLAPAYEVLTATDGQDALELLAREAPVDLIATDAMMPRLSGTELLASLRATPAWAGLPVLMLTARADQAHRAAAHTLGVDDYLTKPFTPAELLTHVRTLLQRQQVRRHFATLPTEAAASPPASPPKAPASPRPGHPAAGAQLEDWQAQATAHLADEHFGPAELASLLCLSERTLYRRLGELAGLTPAAWLRELRLSQARRRLEAGDFGSVADVAEAVGFGSAKYFATLYAERFGRRPGDYRP